MQRVLFQTALVWAVLVVPATTWGQSLQPNDGQSQVDLAGLDIQAVAGWDGTVDTSMPVPLSFLLSNFSENVVEGELILSDPLNDKSVSLGEVFVGPNGVKRFSSVQALPNWIQCIATFQNEDGILWRRELAFMTGKDFSELVNYLLYIDDGGRLLQWPVDSGNSEMPSSQYTPAADRGRPVRPLAVKSWQVPQHPGPLTAAQAIVFSETASADMLNDLQWDAVSKWMCLGGTIFVSEKSQDVIDLLKRTSPLLPQPLVNIGDLAVHRCGGGSIRIFSGPLFSADDKSTVQAIAEAASQLSRHNLLTILDDSDLGWWRSVNADKTRMLVVAVFGIYTVLSGLVTLLMFRQSRRRIGIYTSVVVTLGCLAAIALGGLLRTSKGDVRWMSVTKSGPGGLVQLAKIDMQSAGGRNTLLTMKGRNPDLQRIEADSIGYQPYYYYRQESNRTSYPAFSVQANLLTEEPDAFQIKIPITPWGYRQAYATTFESSARTIEAKVTYEPPENKAMAFDGMSGLSTATFGTFTVTLKNQLSLDLKQCRFVISSTRINMTPGRDSTQYDPRTGNYRMVAEDSIGDPVLTESTTMLPDLLQSTTATIRVNGMSDAAEDQWNSSGQWHDATRSLPTAAYDGGTSAWIIGVLSTSPILSIDQQRSDFDPGEAEAHLFVHEIPSEDLPVEWLEFHRSRLEHQMRTATQLKAQ